MRDELQYKDGSNERLSIFHGNDKLISVEDLWHAWKKSQGKLSEWQLRDDSHTDPKLADQKQLYNVSYTDPKLSWPETAV